MESELSINCFLLIYLARMCYVYLSLAKNINFLYYFVLLLLCCLIMVILFIIITEQRTILFLMLFGGLAMAVSLMFPIKKEDFPGTPISEYPDIESTVSSSYLHSQEDHSVDSVEEEEKDTDEVYSSSGDSIYQDRRLKRVVRERRFNNPIRRSEEDEDTSSGDYISYDWCERLERNVRESRSHNPSGDYISYDWCERLERNVRDSRSHNPSGDYISQHWRERMMARGARESRSHDLIPFRSRDPHIKIKTQKFFKDFEIWKKNEEKYQ